MDSKANFPIGIEDFERIRKDGFYYVDKTRLIKGLVNHMVFVNLFTRPRRFGKTLNMSMLKYFFEIGSDRTLFDGLEISREEELCDSFLLQSDSLSETERKQYKAMIHVDDNGVFTMEDSLLKNSMLLLSCFLQKHYGQKTIILIDEYDVPLDKAYRSGYYDAMVELVRA